MNRDPTAAAGTAGMRCTCTACPLLCDDVVVAPDGVDRACDRGRAAIAEALQELEPAAACSPAIEAAENGVPLPRETAIVRAAAMLCAGRRALVTGLVDATLEAIIAACDLAETLGAAVDAGHPDASAAAGPTIARAGAVTADWEELRDRADLVVFWNCDPGRTHPRFLQRFVLPPLGDGRRRRTIAVGPTAVMPFHPLDQHLPLAEDRAVELARGLQLSLDLDLEPDASDAAFAAACSTLGEAVRSASCAAFVTSASAAVGLDSWSIAHLVRRIAHRRPAFEVPLAGTGADAAGAAAVSTWRYGAAGGIARADRAGGRFLPAEAAAASLLSRGEVDVVLVVGRIGEDLETALTVAGPGLLVVRIAAGTPVRRAIRGRTIELRCADTQLSAGSMLRGDGRQVALLPPHASPLPPQVDLIAAVHAAVAGERQRLAGARP